MTSNTSDLEPSAHAQKYESAAPGAGAAAGAMSACCMSPMLGYEKNVALTCAHVFLPSTEKPTEPAPPAAHTKSSESWPSTPVYDRWICSGPAARAAALLSGAGGGSRG